MPDSAGNLKILSNEVTVVDGTGQARRVAVRQSFVPAVEYEFYIPLAIWDEPPTQRFMNRLLEVENAATVSSGLSGVWRGENEQTSIFRIILRANKFDRNNVRTAFQHEVSQLLAELSLSDRRQETVMFTETETMMFFSSIS